MPDEIEITKQLDEEEIQTIANPIDKSIDLISPQEQISTQHQEQVQEIYPPKHLEVNSPKPSSG